MPTRSVSCCPWFPARARMTAGLLCRKSRSCGETGSSVTQRSPRITPKLNLTATTLQKFISWQLDQLQEPVFTCSLTREEIDVIVVKPYEVPDFSIHTQSTERAMKQVTEVAAAVVGQQALDGFIRARTHHREAMPSFRQKKDIMSTF